MSTLFISHSVHDRALVEAVVDLLESGVGIPLKNIFCSSLKGQSIKPGKDFADSIRENLKDADCVLAFISEAYYASAFCMCELGGVWLVGKGFLPVLVPPVDHSDLKAVLSGLQVLKIASEEDLDELRDELVERLQIQAHPTPRWTKKRKEFLAALPELIKKSSFKGPVSREKYNKLLDEARSYKDECETLEHTVGERDKLIAALKKAKDAKTVASVVRKHSTTAEAFEELVSAAAKALDPLPQPVQEALYYRMRGETYHPNGGEEWEDTQHAIEYGLIETNSDETGVTPNEHNSKVHKAVAALDELSTWLSGAPEDFFEWYQQETDGEDPNISLRSFWERHLR